MSERTVQLRVAEPHTGRRVKRVRRREDVTPAARSRLSSIGLPIAGMVGMISAWWLVTFVFGIQKFLLPAPPDVVRAFLRLPGYLVTNGRVTLIETLGGFLAATVVGLLIGLLVTAAQVLERAILPVLVTVNSIPKLAVAPLLTVWLGFGQMPKMVMVFLLCFFPIVLSTMSGLAATPTDLGEVARSLSATRFQTFVKIRIPWALPQIFVGLKVAISLAVIGAVVGEFTGTGTDRGLGAVIVMSGASADTPLAFAAIGLLAVMSVGLFYLLVVAERLLLPWVREASAQNS
jgi:NitT/TauT family transport system permease protein